jgi:hypothetical protein
MDTPIPIRGSKGSDSRVRRIREALLPDHAYEDELAEALDCSRRKVQRLGLPFVKIGARRAYSISGSRDVLRRQQAA